MHDKRDPWSKFYWADWQSDELLGSVSLGARALWLEMLGIAHKATPQGHVLVNGHAPDDVTLARIARCSVAEVRKHKAELARAGIPDIVDGTWISRRMVRDAHRRAVNRANGEGGGNPKLKDKASDNRSAPIRITDPVKPADKSHDARDPDARCQKPEGGQNIPVLSEPPREPEPDADPLAIPPFLRARTLHPQALQALGDAIDASPGWLVYGPLTELLEAGATEAEVLDACRAAAEQKTAHPLRSWAYVAAIVETNRTRKAAHVEADQAQSQRSAERVATVVARLAGKPEQGVGQLP
jgi:hypothetical protein